MLLKGGALLLFIELQKHLVMHSSFYLWENFINMVQFIELKELIDLIARIIILSVNM